MGELSNQQIDILLATYNGSKFIREQIESIQAQSFEDWRLLVSDDGSNDSTINIVKELAANDPRISIVLEHKRFGSAKENFYNLLTVSHAPYLMFCDQDDVWLSNKIETQLAHLKEMESAYGYDTPLLVFSDMEVVDSTLKTISDSFENYSRYDPTRTKVVQLIAQNNAAGCSMLFNRAVADLCLMSHAVIGNYMMHDWLVMLVASAFGHIEYLDKVFNLYRQHGTNEVGARRFSLVMSIVGSLRSKRAFRLRCFMESIVQAQTFLSIYGSMLDEKTASCVSCFARIDATVPTAERILLLVRSRCWKRGVRKIGQLFDVIFINKGNKVC